MVSCSQKKAGNFEISGKVANAPAGQTLYVEKVSFQSATNEIEDSVKLKATGDYALKGKGTEEGLYLLTLDHKPVVIFVNDNSKIQANIDLNANRNPVFMGSDASDKLYAFITTYRQRDSTLQELSGQMEAVAKVNPADSSLAVLRAHGLKELKGINDEIIAIANTSPDPALICFALDKARNTMEITTVDSLVKSASARFKEHAGLATIKSLLVQSATPQQNNPAAQGDALLNQQAPDLAMTSIDGKPMSISSFKGKYLLVDFWASWCGPCRGENPNVVAAYNKYKDKNFTILGVSLDDDKSAWQQAVKKDGLTWNHMSDLKQWESAAVSTYQFNGIPFNVLIDPAGKIIATSLRGSDLDQKLAEVLK